MDGTDPSTSKASDRRAQVAEAAGLSEIHGGARTALLKYQVECDMEQGLVLSIERIWPHEQGPPPVDMFIVCPVCGEEHTLARQTT